MNKRHWFAVEIIGDGSSFIAGGTPSSIEALTMLNYNENMRSLIECGGGCTARLVKIYPPKVSKIVRKIRNKIK